MTTSTTPSRRSAAQKSANLMVRVDHVSKQVIAHAARIRGVSASDYIRMVVVSQARREVEEARTRTILLSPEEQLAFWQALDRPAELTARQKQLGRVMRGER